MARGRWVFTGLLSLGLASCVPTLSQPRGEAHLAAMRAATQHHHHGRMEEAAAAWDEAAESAERRVDRDEAEYRRARALLRMERPREALVLLDGVADRIPISRRTTRARFDAALARLSLGETDAALASLERIVLERPEDGPASRSLRLLLEARAGEPLAARLSFLSALYAAVGETDLGDDILAAQAQALRADGDDAGAVAALEQLVTEHPYPSGQRWDEAFSQLADIAEAREDYAGALDYLRRMIEVDELPITPGSQTLPGFPSASLRMARILRDRLNDPAGADAQFRSTAARFPNSRLRDDALYELGAMWLDRDRHDLGCGILDEVVEAFEVGHARRLAAARLARDCGPRSNAGALSDAPGR